MILLLSIAKVVENIIDVLALRTQEKLRVELVQKLGVSHCSGMFKKSF